jgi:DNA-binding NarL/FixJ family response regulator
MIVAISPIRDVHGVVTDASTVARDITDITRARVCQHLLETELQRARLHLASELRRRDIEGAHHAPVHGLSAELTHREVEVLELMAGGLLNKQVARVLGLQLNTVRNHSQSILCKLQAHSRLEAVTTAVRDGIIDYPTRAIAT